VIVTGRAAVFLQVVRAALDKHRPWTWAEWAPQYAGEFDAVQHGDAQPTFDDDFMTNRARQYDVTRRGHDIGFPWRAVTRCGWLRLHRGTSLRLKTWMRN
jgi:hypothetical protein